MLKAHKQSQAIVQKVVKNRVEYVTFSRYFLMALNRLVKLLFPLKNIIREKTA